MDIKEISDFIDWTLDKGRYPTAKDYSIRERCFSQTMKISEEVGELNEQVLGKFGGQRLEKMDKMSDEKLENELADVIFSTIRLARLLDIDVEKILSNRLEILRKRTETLEKVSYISS